VVLSPNDRDILQIYTDLYGRDLIRKQDDAIGINIPQPQLVVASVCKSLQQAVKGGLFLEYEHTENRGPRLLGLLTEAETLGWASQDILDVMCGATPTLSEEVKIRVANDIAHGEEAIEIIQTLLES
jgi:hypothetical protein